MDFILSERFIAFVGGACLCVAMVGLTAFICTWGYLVLKGFKKWTHE